MKDVFGPGGAIARALPRYEPRTEQAALAAAVEHALATGEHLVAEAGTGIGKSLAYLVPALESGGRVVVATATKALQAQLLGSDIPLAAAALGRELRVAVLKGRQNYLCRKSAYGLGLLGRELFANDGDAAEYERLLPWIDGTEAGDRAELEREPSASLWAELSVGSDRCHGRRCAFLSTCFSEAARARAADADLVIANHALYFADLGLRADGDGTGVLPEHDAVVFDEAHRLEDAAASWLGGRVSAASLRLLAADVDRACRDADQPVPAGALDRVERRGVALLDAVAPPSGRRRVRQPPVDLCLVLASALGELAAALRGTNDELDVLARRAVRLAAAAETMVDDGDHERVVWAEPDAVVWAPVDVGDTLRELLWDTGPTSVLVSATLGVGGQLDFVRRRLGLARTRELVLDSPYDYREQALLYLPPGLPDPGEPDALARVADEVAALCLLSAGRALVLTSSYRALDAIAAHIRPRLPYRVLVQGEAPRERLLEQFRADVESVLVATATFWQGVDIPGESLSLLVIDKLPFGVPDEPLVEARCERLSAEGEDPFLAYMLPTAVLQLRQGFGRLVRSHSDRGVVAILDPRVRTRRYGRVFLESLPRLEIADSRDAVARFFGAETLVAV